jgi:hypothetical protein
MVLGASLLGENPPKFLCLKPVFFAGMRAQTIMLGEHHEGRKCGIITPLLTWRRYSDGWISTGETLAPLFPYKFGEVSIFRRILTYQVLSDRMPHVREAYEPQVNTAR